MNIGKEIYSHYDTPHVVARLQTLLNTHGIKYANDSILGDLLARLELRKDEIKESEPLDHDVKTFRTHEQQLLGLLWLAKKIISLEHSTNFSTIVKHIDLLGRGQPNQNSQSLKSDKASDKIFELLVGCACVPFVTNLDMDDPVKSSDGKNPDVLFDYMGEKWGVACKVPNGQSAKTLFDNIKRAVEQIECCPATKGIVAISLKNVFDHDSLFPITDNMRFPATVAKHISYPLSKHAQNVFERLLEENGKENVQELFKGRKALPMVLVFSASTGLLKEERKFFLGRVRRYLTIPVTVHRVDHWVCKSEKFDIKKEIPFVEKLYAGMLS
jgi:hypothetical protein